MTIRIQDLYTFHVVARTGAMQVAAHELGVTPGAISQRIRAVEQRHGLRLFTRSKNGIMLTPAGLALQADMSPAFVVIEAANRKHFSALKDTIRINTCATFAHSALVSSVGRFAARHPTIKVSVETEDRLVNLKSEPVDLAIRHEFDTQLGVSSEWLCSPKLLVVVSPELLNKHGPLTEPSDCLRYKLLPDATGQDWSVWFEAHDVDAKNAVYGTQYGSDFLTVKAAIDSQGLALVSDIHVKEGLVSGQLVRALDSAWPTTFAYYAVALSETFERPSVSTFVKWLKKDLGEPHIR